MTEDPRFKLFSSNYLLKKLVLSKFNINPTDFVGITVYRSKTHLYLSKKKLFVKFFETSLGNDILPSFSGF